MGQDFIPQRHLCRHVRGNTACNARRLLSASRRVLGAGEASLLNRKFRRVSPPELRRGVISLLAGWPSA